MAKAVKFPEGGLIDVYVVFEYPKEEGWLIGNALLTEVPGLTKETMQGIIGRCQDMCGETNIHIVNIIRLDRREASPKPEGKIQVISPFGG